jgi:hypothetical protein
MVKTWVNYKRRSSTREIKQLILIVCQGEQTEPNYFRSFKVATAHIDIEFKHKDPKKLVDAALDLKKKNEKNKIIKYDQVWIVFDKDDFSDENFNEAINYAKINGINTAYSNQAFEIWYLLHFNFVESSISRKDYIIKLSEYLGFPYEKNGKMYKRLLDMQDRAIANAEELFKKHALKNRTPAKSDPSTTVHLLVKELNRFK